MTVWHKPPNSREIHKGPSSECKRCGLAKAKKRSSKKSGQLGGNRTAAKKSLGKIRKCSKCAVPISRHSKTGLCGPCYNLKRALNKEVKRDRKSRYCVNPRCSNHISDDNKTGLCLRCYRDKAVTAQYRVHHDEWMKSLLPVAPRT